MSGSAIKVGGPGDSGAALDSHPTQQDDRHIECLRDNKVMLAPKPTRIPGRNPAWSAWNAKSWRIVGRSGRIGDSSR